MHARIRDNAGMTVVELTVTLVVIGVLAFVAYPVMTNILNVLTSKGAAEQVAGAIRQARQYAITSGGNYCIQFSTGFPVVSYTIGATNDGNVSTCTLTATMLTETIANKAAILNITGPPGNPTIVFDPQGNVLNQGASGPYVVQIGVDTQPTSCLSTVAVTLYGGVRSIQC